MDDSLRLALAQERAKPGCCQACEALLVEHRPKAPTRQATPEEIANLARGRR